jgi:hypothetical protein
LPSAGAAVRADVAPTIRSKRRESVRDREFIGMKKYT